jgi:hypothetical protein
MGIRETLILLTGTTVILLGAIRNPPDQTLMTTGTAILAGVPLSARKP